MPREECFRRDISSYFFVCLVCSEFHHKPPQTVVKTVGDDLSLNCSVVGDPPPIVSWKRSKGAWEEKRMKVNGGNLKISALSRGDSGVFICEAKTGYYTSQAKTQPIVTNRKLQLVARCLVTYLITKTCSSTV